MIIIDRPKLKFLLAGRAITVDVGREYRKGRTYAVGTSHKSSTCRVRVVEIEQMAEARWRLTIKRVTEEEPRLLSANPAGMRSDYTNDPKKAARGEPEALRDDQIRDLAKYRAAIAQNSHAKSILELRDRVMADLDEALRTSISREDRDKIRTARHHLRKLGRSA